MRDSGLLHNPATAAAAARGEIQKILDQIEPVSKASLELVRSPTGQLKARRQDLVTRVAVLKEFLSKNVAGQPSPGPGRPGLPPGGQTSRGGGPDAAKVVAGARGGK